MAIIVALRTCCRILLLYFDYLGLGSLGNHSGLAWHAAAFHRCIFTAFGMQCNVYVPSLGSLQVQGQYNFETCCTWRCLKRHGQSAKVHINHVM